MIDPLDWGRMANPKRELLQERLLRAGFTPGWTALIGEACYPPRNDDDRLFPDTAGKRECRKITERYLREVESVRERQAVDPFAHFKYFKGDPLGPGDVYEVIFGDHRQAASEVVDRLHREIRERRANVGVEVRRIEDYEYGWEAETEDGAWFRLLAPDSERDYWHSDWVTPDGEDANGAHGRNPNVALEAFNWYPDPLVASEARQALEGAVDRYLEEADEDPPWA